VPPFVHNLSLVVRYYAKAGIRKENKSLSMYNYSLNVILAAIKKESGLQFNKN